MKRASVYMHENFAGILTEDDEGFHFQYEEEYLNSDLAEPISLTLPLSKTKYSSNILFPFFDGIIPEGWLLDIATKNWKMDDRDRMSVLLAVCYDCIGAVSIREFKEA